MRLLTLLALTALALPASAQKKPLKIVVAGIHTGSKSITPGAIVLHNGKIVALGAPAEVKAPAGAMDLSKIPQYARALGRMHIAPLVVDGNSQRGADGPLKEGPLCPGLSAVDAVNPLHAGWAEAARSGVGLAVFAPDADAVLGGKACLLAPGARLVGATLRREVALFGSIQKKAYEAQGSNPGTRGQAVLAIRNLFAAARDRTLRPSADFRSWRPDAAALREVHEGRMPLALRVGTVGDVDAALALFAELKVRGVLIGANAALADKGALARVAKANVGVILDPLTAATPDRVLAVPGALAKAKIPFGFASRAPKSPESGLVGQAALAVHNGLSAGDAWAALVTGPTRVYGLTTSTALRAGDASIFTIYAGDPRSFAAPVFERVRGALNVTRMARRLMGGGR